MRELIREQLGDEEDCSYLDGRVSRTRYRLIEHCSAVTYQRMLERGWRRFGNLFFRPTCDGCLECRSLRVDVEAFRPNRSMRRTWRRNEDLRTELRRPSMSEEHLRLYDRYHADMTFRKGWPSRHAEPFDYLLTFVQGHRDFGHELLFWHGERLVGVALVDILPRALSAVYAFFDPAERRRALGVFSILSQIELARSRGIPHVYLGYRVAENVSMRYKANYRPHELLVGRPEFNEQPEWGVGEELGPLSPSGPSARE
jgi:arginine-tRNA-protein transferase